MVRPIIKIAILCLTFQLLTGLSAPFEKESQGQVSNDQYRAKVLVHKGYPDYSVTLQLSDLEKGSEQELSFEAFFESIDELVLMAGEKLLVVGQLPQHAGVQIVIVDLRQNALQDTIRTHYRQFTLSPNRRYLLHTTFYGRLEPPNQRKSLLLAYDLTLPAEKNRLSSAPNLSMENAGLPIFPRLNVDRSSYSIFEDPRNHVFISPFLWSEDSQRILFVEIVENKRFLVLVNIGAGLQDVRILKRPIDLMASVDQSSIPSVRRADLEANPPRFIVSALNWHTPKEEKIVAKLNTSDYWLPNELVLKVPTTKPSK